MIQCFPLIHSAFLLHETKQETLPPVVRQTGTPRAVAPNVPMGANAGEPNNVKMQSNILRDTLQKLVEIQTPGKIVPLPYEYIAQV